MTRKIKDVLKNIDGVGECFVCSNTGFYIKSRVSFSTEFLKQHSLVALLDGHSFIDWNNALAYCHGLVKSGAITEDKFYRIYNHVRDINGLGLDESISFKIESKPYPKDLQGEGPGDYIAKYSEDRLTKGEQSIVEFKAWQETRNKDVPKVETEEQKEKKRQALRLLKTKGFLRFDVWLPASSLEKQAEDQRVAEVEAEEERLSKEEPDSKTGKRKRLTKQKEAQKRRKINKDGMKPLQWVTAETESYGLLAKSIFPGVKGRLDYNITEEKDAEGHPLTILAFSHPSSGGVVARFVLPGKM